ncbi:MAG: DUF1552 domain-containing protein [Archangium sp.]
MKLERRQLLKALGLGALVAPRFSFAQTMTPPKRIFFFVQPHGHVPSSWKMPIPGGPTDSFAERDLTQLPEAEFCKVLSPLYQYRQKTLAIEGLSHLAALEDIAFTARTGGGDFNNHNVAVADLLTGRRAAQHPGFPCTGGGISIDQLLGQRLATPGRVASRVYGGDYVPNQAIAPFSFLGASQPTPLVKNPLDAFNDLVGVRPPTDNRQIALARARLSMLDGLADEYGFVASKLGTADRQKLESHQQLVRDLEVSLATQVPMTCDSTFDPSGVKTRQFMRLTRMAFACDLTRVITYAAPVPLCPEFNYPANADVHASYAHASVSGLTSCGQMYTPLAEQAMTDLSIWYGNHLAYLLSELESVPEGNGTLLDSTLVVWVTELGTPTHRHHDAFTVLFGGSQGFFKTGRYVRYPITHDSPVPGDTSQWGRCGPAHNHLWVSVLRAMGQPDNEFGTTSATSTSGEVIDMTGPLSELHT